MKEREFHLCREPWICVMEEDYQIKKVTLPEALLHAEMYLGLAGETGSQNIAILRLLLAVLHTVFSRKNEEGKDSPIEDKKEPLRRWEAIWRRGKFPENPITDYFHQWEDRFWLFDSEYPFYQVPGIEGTINPAKKMNGALVESNNKVQLFSMKNGKEKEVLSYDEAARWLVYLQAFGDTAAKKPSPKLCWVGGLGVVAAKGETLFETLMLNLTLLKDGNYLWKEPKPAWERKKPAVEKLKEIPQPNNQPEILSMQCRRVLLLREDDKVNSFVEAAGEYLEKESAFSEQMTFWTKKTKGANVLEFYPKVHDQARQMWRDFSVLMGKNGHMPGVVSWVSKLKSRKILSRDFFVSFQIVGVEYGSMFCGITDEFSDSLQFHANLLEELGEKWQRHIETEISRCDDYAKAVGRLAASLDKAIGGDGVEAERNAKEQSYYRLDVPFRQWLLEVDPEQNLEVQNQFRWDWRNRAKRIIKNLGQELVDQAGSIAIVGRTVTAKIKNKETKWHYSAPEAFNYFLSELKKIDDKQSGR